MAEEDRGDGRGVRDTAKFELMKAGTRADLRSDQMSRQMESRRLLKAPVEPLGGSRSSSCNRGQGLSHFGKHECRWVVHDSDHGCVDTCICELYPHKDIFEHCSSSLLLKLVFIFHLL